MKVRVDKLLVEKGLSPSRERAQAMILAGRILVNDQKVEKAGCAVDPEASIRIIGDEPRYVSRGGQKLEAALEHWHIDLHGAFCMDIGASTGGFTDCMVQHGAVRVIAVDTGYGQLDFKIRADPRVVLLEKTNGRYLRPQDIYINSAWPAVSFVAMDVSFISATLVLPAAVQAALGHPETKGLQAVILVKPQFEAGRGKLGKGGIVRDPALHKEAVEKVISAVELERGRVIGVIDSPILGAEGNKEFLLCASFPAGG